jgi:hypothetical protein
MIVLVARQSRRRSAFSADVPMSSAPSTPNSAQDAVAAPPRSVRWRSWPLQDDRPRMAMLLAAVAGISLVVGWQAGWQWLVVAVVVQLLPLWRWFIATDYEADERGISQTVLGRTRKVPWRAVAHLEVGRHGIWLLPHSTGQRQRDLRGAYVPCQGRTAEISAAARHFLALDRERARGSGVRERGSGIRDQESGARDQGSGVRGQGAGGRSQGSGATSQPAVEKQPDS